MRWNELQNRLLSSGRLCFSAEEARRLGGWSTPAFHSSIGRAVRRGEIIHLRRGFYVLVPPQFRSFGSPPTLQVVDELMQFEGSPYYVGLLKAAEILGAAHQAVMELQVVSTKRLPAAQMGRSRLRFFNRTRMPDDSLLREGATDAGSYLFSGPALTAGDLLRYPSATGSLDAVATVVAELAEDIDVEEFEALEAAVGLPTLQRLGHVLEHVGAPSPVLDALRGRLAGRTRTVTLDTFGSAAQFDAEKLDPRWKVLVAKPLETDFDSEEQSASVVVGRSLA